MLPDAALLLHPMWRTHSVWLAMLTFFLLYRELFSNREPFTDCELRDTCKLMMGSLKFHWKLQWPPHEHVALE